MVEALADAVVGSSGIGAGSGLLVAIMAMVCCLAGVSGLLVLIVFVVRRSRGSGDSPGPMSVE